MEGCLLSLLRGDVLCIEKRKKNKIHRLAVDYIFHGSEFAI